MAERPAWLKKKLVMSENIFDTKDILKAFRLNTVCESALCPNLNECFSKNYATFLILGKNCTRTCAFCSVKNALPEEPDQTEPGRIGLAIKRLGMRYVVVTSVTRDDLADGGARQFADTVESIRRISPGTLIEILIPDFAGSANSIETVLLKKPDVLAHNMETVKRLYESVRPGSGYQRSLRVLETAKRIDKKLCTKSGIMLGLGEELGEVLGVMRDLIAVKCDILTIGQYLRPGLANIPVKENIVPEQFEQYKNLGERMGFKCVMAGPFVRSSYFAEEWHRQFLGTISPAEDNDKMEGKNYDECNVAATG